MGESNRTCRVVALPSNHTIARSLRVQRLWIARMIAAIGRLRFVGTDVRIEPNEIDADFVPICASSRGNDRDSHVDVSGRLATHRA